MAIVSDKQDILNVFLSLEAQLLRYDMLELTLAVAGNHLESNGGRVSGRPTNGNALRLFESNKITNIYIFKVKAILYC